MPVDGGYAEGSGLGSLVDLAPKLLAEVPAALEEESVDVRVQPRVAAAIGDLASRESVAPEQAVVAAFTPVTWSDGSIGCPRPGMASRRCRSRASC